MLRLALLLTEDRAAAEDLVQDAFVALERRLASLAEPSRAAGYLRVCVINGARTFHRRRLVARRKGWRLIERETAPADAATLLSEEHRAVARAVTRLPPRQRQVVALRYWADMSDAQIARTRGISEGAVRSYASHGTASVARQLPED